jgi:CBS domain-containing protein
MKLKEILQSKGSDTFTIAPSAKVGEAIRLMAERRVGSVLVTAPDGTVLGIFTERDVLNLFASRGVELIDIALSEVMTTDLATAAPETLVDETLALITRRRCRHIPVLQEGKVVGMVSIGDLVKAKLQETEFEVESLREYIGVRY